MSGEKLESIAAHPKAAGGVWWAINNNKYLDNLDTTITKCREFQIEFMKCARTTGVQSSPIQCPEQYEDLRECISSEKRDLRLSFIRAERLRQKRPAVEPMPTYAAKHGDYTMNTENFAEDYY